MSAPASPDCFDDPPDLADLARDLASDPCDPYELLYRDPRSYSERVARCGNLALLRWSAGQAAFSTTFCGSFRHDACAQWRIDGERASGERNKRSLRALYEACPPFDGLPAIHVQPFAYDPRTDDPRSLHKIGQRARDRNRKRPDDPIEWSRVQVWLGEDFAVGVFFSTDDLSTKRDRWSSRRVHPDVAREWLYDELLKPGVLAKVPSASDGCPWRLPPEERPSTDKSVPMPSLGIVGQSLAPRVVELINEYVAEAMADAYAAGQRYVDRAAEKEIVEQAGRRAVAVAMAEDHDRQQAAERSDFLQETGDLSRGLPVSDKKQTG